MFDGLVINPAYAGANEALSLMFIDRRQWVGVDKAPSTQTLLAHTLFMKKQFGLGLNVTYDKIGVHKNFSALADYAYHLKVGEESYLSMGIQAGIHNIKSDYASLFNGNNDPKIYNANVSETFFDFGVGVYYRSPRFHLGLSAPELLPQEISFHDTVSVSLKHVNYFLFSKYRIIISESLNAEPGVLLKYLPGLEASFDINMNMIYREALTVGFSYRRKESVDFLLKAQVTPQLQFGYSYDHPIGYISKLSNGSHEVMIHYIFRYTQTQVPSPR
jgi:type IX secretion system PorP/SprF family membrane protein